MDRPKVLALPVSLLVKAEWNYKTEGTPEQIEKLAESIKKDRSAGVLAVREIGEGKYEVLDGNHRLDAIMLVGWEQVPCENFGAISDATAVLIARRRNHQWFNDDPLRYAELLRDVVLPEMSLDEMARFMPDSREELENAIRLLDFNWEQFGGKGSKDSDGEGFKILRLDLPQSVFALWEQWLERVNRETGAEPNHIKAFEYAMAEALATPEREGKVSDGERGIAPKPAGKRARNARRSAKAPEAEETPQETAEARKRGRKTETAV